MNDLFILFIMMGLLYLCIIHLAYFLFGAFFEVGYNQKIKYRSIYTLQSKMEKGV